MNITIMNYNDEKVTVDVGDNVATINIDVISGDEVARVTYKDYTTILYDSADIIGNWRLMDCYDRSYEVYNFHKEENLIDNPLWKNRKTSYDSAWSDA